MSISNNTIYLGWGQDKAVTTDQRHPLGTRGELPDGSVFYYSKAGEAIGAGQLTMQKAGVALHDMDLALQTAAAVGDQSIAVTLGATAATIDQYGDGTIYVNDGPGEGHRYHIKTAGVGGTAGQAHAAVASAGTLTAFLNDNEQVREAMTTAASLLGLMENSYSDVEIFDANDIDGPALGVAPTEIADNEFFWNQTAGDAACLMDATTFVLGSAVEASSSVDGAVTLHDVSANTDREALGTVQLIVAASGDSGMVKLSIRP